MNKKILYGILVLVFLGAAFMAGKLVADRGSQTPRGVTEGPIILWEPALTEGVKAGGVGWSPGGKDQVMDIIKKMQDKLDQIPASGPLTEKAIGEIASVYGTNGILTGYDGTTYRGEREIAMYFRLLSLTQSVTDVRIEIKLVYAKEFVQVANNMKGSPDDVIHSLYFVLATSYKIDGVPVDPPSSTECPHIRKCECSTKN
jgi:hypothetical protein